MRELIRQAYAKAVKLNYELSEFDKYGFIYKRKELDKESIKAKCRELIETCEELIRRCDEKT